VEGGVRKAVLLQSLLLVVDGSSIMHLFALAQPGEGSLSDFDYGGTFGAEIRDAAFTGEAGRVAVVDDASNLRLMRLSESGVLTEGSGELALRSEPLALEVDPSSSSDHVTLYVLEAGWIEVVDASDPAGLELLARFETGGARAVAGWGPEVIVAGKDGTFEGKVGGAMNPLPLTAAPAADIFDLFHDGSALTAAGNEVTGLYETGKDPDAYELWHVLPGAGEGAFEVLLHRGSLFLAAEDEVRVFRVSPPPMAWEGRVRILGKGGNKAELGEGDEGFPAGPILGVKHGGEKDWFAAAGKDGHLHVYKTSKAGLSLAATASAAHGFDRVRSAPDHRIAVFSAGGVVQVFDLADPGHPVLAAEVEVEEAVTDAAAAKKSLCLALEGGRMAVADMGDPGSGLHEIEGIGPLGPYPLQAEALRCWGVEESGGAFSVNLIDKTAPVVESYLPAGIVGRVLGLLRTGPHLLLATNRRLVVVDASRAGVLEILGSAEYMETFVDGMAAAEDRVMVYGWDGAVTAFQVVDLSDPAEPEVLGHYDMPFRVLHVEPAGERLLLTFESAGGPVHAWLTLPPGKPPSS
jgi:hypothetical protein